MAEKLKIIPLGGLNEIGKNMTVYEYGGDIIVIDVGMGFPDDDMYGIDVVIPDFSYLIKNKDRIRGIFLTHGHEDHIGSIPYLLRDINVPIYATRMTAGLVKLKLEEHRLLNKTKLITCEAGEVVKAGKFSVEFIHANHSIADAVCFAIKCGVGTVVHTGDFKIDPTPIQGGMMDLGRLGQLGKEGVLALLADSTNVENPGRSLPERQVRDDLDAIFSEVKGRIIIALFSSHIRRIRTVLELAEKYGRSVLVSGRSLSTNIEKAVELGLLDQPKHLYNEAAGFPELDPGQTVVLATGTQGEALSALARIARGEHRQLSLHEGDTVIMSSRVIPGNARAISKVLNQIYRLGAEVYHNPDRTVHATGHACRAELKDIIQSVQPEYFIPVHGEYRHLALHAGLAEECGVARDHIRILEDGQPVTFTPDGIRMEEPVFVESVMVDGKGVGDVGRMVLKERRILGGEGLVAVVLVIAEETGEVLHGPEMISRGFVFEQQYSHLLEDAKCLVLDQLESTNPNDTSRLSDRIRSSLRRFFRDVLGRDPIVVPIVTQI